MVGSRAVNANVPKDNQASKFSWRQGSVRIGQDGWVCRARHETSRWKLAVVAVVAVVAMMQEGALAPLRQATRRWAGGEIGGGVVVGSVGVGVGVGVAGGLVIACRSAG
jgi:hypothetical protein